MRYGAIATRRQAAPTTARFYSDPGPGNFYLGVNTPSRSTLATHESKMGAPIAVLRTYSTSGAPNWSSIDSIIAGGRIPWTSWKTPSTLTIADIATGAGDAWIDSIASGFAARAPWPVWWTFWHEPENDAPTNGVNTANYRAAQRRMATRIKAAGVTNSVFACVAYMCPWTWQTASGRDWRTWYPDVNPAVTAFGGTPLAPRQSDFYVHGDPNSVVEVLGIDFYHSWEIQDGPAQDPMTRWNNITGPNVWANYLSPATGFLNKPYGVSEWSTAAAQDGIVFDPNGDGTFTLTEYNAETTITYYPDQTDAWIDSYFGNKDHGFVAFCYWDESSTKTTSQVATNPLGICDPGEERWKRIGLWGNSPSAKLWTG